MRKLFVFGFPRSGTTLMQRLLNSYDDTLIWGEQSGYLTSLADAFYRIYECQRTFRDPRKWTEKKGAPSESNYDPQGRMNSFNSPEQWLQHHRDFLDRVLFNPNDIAGKKYAGFKDPMYGFHSGGTCRAIEFLELLYPDAIHIYLIRNPLNAVTSYQKSLPQAKAIPVGYRVCRHWISQNLYFKNMYERRAGQSYLVRYEDMIAQKGSFTEMLTGLGKQIGPDQFKVYSAFKGRGSSFSSDSVTENYNERWKISDPEWMAFMLMLLRDAGIEFGYPIPTANYKQKIHGWILMIRMVLYKFSAFLKRNAKL